MNLTGGAIDAALAGGVYNDAGGQVNGYGRVTNLYSNGGSINARGGTLEIARAGSIPSTGSISAGNDATLKSANASIVNYRSSSGAGLSTLDVAVTNCGQIGAGTEQTLTRALPARVGRVHQTDPVQPWPWHQGAELDRGSVGHGLLPRRIPATGRP